MLLNLELCKRLIGARRWSKKYAMYGPGPETELKNGVNKPTF
jgi:hypothetical protein